VRRVGLSTWLRHRVGRERGRERGDGGRGGGGRRRAVAPPLREGEGEEEGKMKGRQGGGEEEARSIGRGEEEKFFLR